MTTETKDGGPAFPVPDGEASNHGVRGMSLRDWFAGQAMAGLLSTMDTEHPFYEAPTIHMAKLSFAYADAMLKSREATHED